MQRGFRSYNLNFLCQDLPMSAVSIRRTTCFGVQGRGTSFRQIGQDRRDNCCLRKATLRLQLAGGSQLQEELKSFHTLTSPERPLHSIFFLKTLRDQKIENWAKARDAQRQTESQAQLLIFEPDSCDAVLQHWREQRQEAELQQSRVMMCAGGEVCLT